MKKKILLIIFTLFFSNLFALNFDIDLGFSPIFVAQHGSEDNSYYDAVFTCGQIRAKVIKKSIGFELVSNFGLPITGKRNYTTIETVGGEKKNVDHILVNKTVDGSLFLNVNPCFVYKAILTNSSSFNIGLGANFIYYIQNYENQKGNMFYLGPSLDWNYNHKIKKIDMKAGFSTSVNFSISKNEIYIDSLKYVMNKTLFMIYPYIVAGISF